MEENKELRNLKNNVDSWIKQTNERVNELEGYKQLVRENNRNIQHNYDMIHSLKDKVDELVNEVNALKIIQLASIRQKR